MLDGLVRSVRFDASRRRRRWHVASIKIGGGGGASDHQMHRRRTFPGGRRSTTILHKRHLVLLLQLLVVLMIVPPISKVPIMAAAAAAAAAAWLVVPSSPSTSRRSAPLFGLGTVSNNDNNKHAPKRRTVAFVAVEHTPLMLSDRRGGGGGAAAAAARRCQFVEPLYASRRTPSTRLDNDSLDDDDDDGGDDIDILPGNDWKPNAEDDDIVEDEFVSELVKNANVDSDDKTVESDFDVDVDDDVDDADEVVMSNDEIDDDEEEDDIDDLDEDAILDDDDEDDDDDDDETTWTPADDKESNVVMEFDEIDWNEDVDGAMYELQDDADDANYMHTKQLAQQAAQNATQRAAEEDFDAMDFVQNVMTNAQKQRWENLPIMQQVARQAAALELTEADVRNVQLPQDAEAEVDIMQDETIPDLDQDQVNLWQQDIGLTDDLMRQLDDTFQRAHRTARQEPPDRVLATDWSIDMERDLDNQTLLEIDACLEEIGGSSYNVTQWLLYDLQFNVTNLVLAAVQHNPQAPILLMHWIPQLVTYERYAVVRERNFDFNWNDVAGADLSELERYYRGFGYDSIPSKAPAETGIISLEELDEEEIKMAAFESWMKQVYNPENDRKDFDDDDLRDEDNVFSEFYEPPQHPDLPAFDDAMDDLASWQAEIGAEEAENDPAVKAYRDSMGQAFSYDVIKDDEFEREFRGQLVVACSGHDDDLQVAERITTRFAREFGKQVFVETRVLALARYPDDAVFEVWLESYEIDLLHSKKRATSNAKGWVGPAEVDDAQLDYLVERVRFLISDDARYSYRYDLEMAE